MKTALPLNLLGLLHTHRQHRSIQNEKKNYLFAVYNSIVISVSYTGPFFILNRSSSVAVILISITIAIFVWIAICTFTSLLVRLNTTKKQDENKR